MAAATCLFAALCAFAALAGRPGWQGWRLGAACAGAAAAAAAGVGLAFRRLPGDLPLRPVDAAAAAAAAAAPPEGQARLRVALRPEALGWYRVDVELDGRRVGQLRPGTAFTVPVAPGPHAVTMRVRLRRLRARELLNALPGTDSDLVIAASGGRARSYAISRHGLPALLADPRMAVVHAG